MTNKNKKPTKTDRQILAWLQAGNSINYWEALTKFGSSCLRDNVYRLRQDGKTNGYDIYSETIYYKPGTNKHYEKYFMTAPKIIKAGAKTVKEQRRIGV